MKQIFTLLLFVPLITFSQQSLEQQLDSIATPDEAKSFIKINKSTKGKLFIFNKEKHKTRLANDLFKLPKGEKKVIITDFKKTYYKVINKSDVLHHRVSYIYFDGNKMTLEKINVKRTKIIAQYNDGYKFEALSKLYSMDSGANKGGDLGWFAEGMMHQEFENAVKAHSTGDIFTIDINDRNWHYIVLKTFDPKPIEEIIVLKFTETND